MVKKSPLKNTPLLKNELRIQYILHHICMTERRFQYYMFTGVPKKKPKAFCRDKETNFLNRKKRHS